MSGKPVRRLFPVQALLDATGLCFDQARRRARCGGLRGQRILAEGLTVAEADRWAIRCGLHPAEVWPEFVRCDDREEVVA